MGMVEEPMSDKRARTPPVIPQLPPPIPPSRFYAMSHRAGNTITEIPPRVPDLPTSMVSSCIGPIPAILGADRVTRQKKAAQLRPPAPP